MLDSVYQTVQGLMNKEQLGYLKPIHFNLFADLAQRKEYNQLFTDLKVNVRKQNWHLNGKDMADLAEHHKQLLEHLSDVETITGVAETSLSDVRFTIPSGVEFIKGVFVAGLKGKDITKVSYSEFKLLQRNIYASPTECSPLCAKVGNELRVLPITLLGLEIQYLRTPKTPKWTFIEYDGKPMFNATATDFQDFDLPKYSKDRLIISIAEMAGVTIRDAVMIQSANQEQSQDAQLDNKQ